MWCDVAARYQAPGTVDFAKYDGVIVQASHGTVEEVGWRAQVNEVVAAGKILGLYHFAELGPSAAAQASFFHGLVGYLKPAQVRGGFWVDVEVAGLNSAWVDQFRSAVALPWCGLYSDLSMFNGPLLAYQHFALNWLAFPFGTVVAPGWSIPDHILVQTGVVNGVDQDLPTVAQPYPGAWAA